MRTLIEWPGRMRFHTHFRPLFEAIGLTLRQYRWLVTEWEALGSERFGFTPDGSPHVVTGEQLARLAMEHDPQFIWGVFSGFRPAFPLEVEQLVTTPWAGGNESIWDPEGGVQYPGAEIEIICWDSTCAIVATEDPGVHQPLRECFPEAKLMPPPPR